MKATKTILSVLLLSSPVLAGEKVSWDRLYGDTSSSVLPGSTTSPTKKNLWWIGMEPSPLIQVGPGVQQLFLASKEGAPARCLMVTGSDGKNYYVEESQIDASTCARIKQAWSDVEELKKGNYPKPQTVRKGNAAGSWPPVPNGESVYFDGILVQPGTGTGRINVFSSDSGGGTPFDIPAGPSFGPQSRSTPPARSVPQRPFTVQGPQITIRTTPVTNAGGINMLSRGSTPMGRTTIGVPRAATFGNTDCGVPGGG